MLTELIQVGDEILQIWFGGWRKLCNEELHNLNSLPSDDGVKENNVSQIGEKNAYMILVGKRPLEIPRCMLMDNGNKPSDSIKC
jgi:hypothetical protein